MRPSTGLYRRAQRRVTALTVATFLTAVVGSVTFVSVMSPSANADPLDACTGSSGAIVAVDFGPFGGPVVRGCDTTLTSGMDLLHDGGFTTKGTVHDGPGFICRIGNSAFTGGKEFPTPEVEACGATPLPDAYWSYWLADPGKDTWTYSTLGAMANRPKPGGVEAWVFGGTQIGGEGGQPKFTPDSVRAKGGASASATPSGKPQEDDPAVGAKDAAKWLAARFEGRDNIRFAGTEEADYLSTLYVAQALTAAGTEDKKLKEAHAYLTKNVGGLEYEGGEPILSTTASVSAVALFAETTGGDAKAFGGQDLTKLLTDKVCTVAGEGCSAPGDFIGSYWTSKQAQGVLALVRAGVTPPAATVERLKQIQCADGGFARDLPAPGVPCISDPVSTAETVLPLKLIPGNEDAVKRATGYLLAQQQADGSYLSSGSTAGDTITTASVAQTLLALGKGPQAESAQRWIMKERLEDGSFPWDPTLTEGDDDFTAAAVPALSGTHLDTLEHDPFKPPVVPSSSKPAPSSSSAKPADSTTPSAPGSSSASASSSVSASTSASASNSADSSASSAATKPGKGGGGGLASTGAAVGRIALWSLALVAFGAGVFHLTRKRPVRRH